MRYMVKELQRCFTPLTLKRQNSTLYRKFTKQTNLDAQSLAPSTGHTANISKFVDYHLQDHVKHLASYIKDTTDFINKTKDLQVLEDSVLVTIDVSALYTNIPDNEEIQAVKNTLSKAFTPIFLLTVITTFLTLILTLNNCIVNGIHYLQTKGCANCTSTYANIFMGEFEEKHIYPRIKDKRSKYLRYIDDIFMIWTGTQAQLEDFTKQINKVHPLMKFTT